MCFVGSIELYSVLFPWCEIPLISWHIQSGIGFGFGFAPFVNYYYRESMFGTVTTVKLFNMLHKGKQTI